MSSLGGSYPSRGRTFDKSSAERDRSRSPGPDRYGDSDSDSESGDPVVRSLASDIRKVLKPDTHGEWQGTPIDATSTAYVVRADGTRSDVQAEGEAHGCHICNKKLASNPDGSSWTADHQPPLGLTDGAREHFLGTGTVRRIYPQCRDCSNKQAGFIRSLPGRSRGGYPELTTDERNLITGHDKSAAASDGSSINNYLATEWTSTSANDTEKDNIQRLGKTFGCHTCGSKFPAAKYEVDHVPPVEFMTAWMRALCVELKIDIPKGTYRPVCPSHQRRQGPHIGMLARRARRICASHFKKIIIYG